MKIKTVDQDDDTKFTPTVSFEIGEFCHHRHEEHEVRLACDGKSRRCIRCGLYFELEQN